MLQYLSILMGQHLFRLLLFVFFLATRAAVQPRDDRLCNKWLVSTKLCILTNYARFMFTHMVQITAMRRSLSPHFFFHYYYCLQVPYRLLFSICRAFSLNTLWLSQLYSIPYCIYILR
uniref:Secreted protein n=1 Tax=Amblyomma americanum TaxID=6943 RepID=A0A0C9RWF4_AMBAM